MLLIILCFGTLSTKLYGGYMLNFNYYILKPNHIGCNSVELITKSKTIINSIQSKKIANSYLILTFKSMCKKTPMSVIVNCNDY